MDLNSSRHILNPTNISLCNTIISRSSLLNSGRKGNTHTQTYLAAYVAPESGFGLACSDITGRAERPGPAPHKMTTYTKALGENRGKR